MIKASRLLSILGTVLVLQAAAQGQPSDRRITKAEYIERYKEAAIREMLSHNIPASITMAQGILESDYGNSPLARYANNHFGIKCHKSWTGPGFYQDDDEANECFRKYYNPDESYRDHSEFLTSRSRYSDLFTLKITDYKGWARGLKKAGYATNPRYPELLIRVIEDNNLHELDQIKKIPKTAKPKQQQPVVNQPAMPREEVQVHANNIKFVHAQSGDTPYKLAKRYEKGLWEITKYNDLDRNATLRQGDVIYLQPKRKNALQDSHTVRAGETMHGISQMYGIKLKQLYKKNAMSPGDEPEIGQKLQLSSKKK